MKTLLENLSSRKKYVSIYTNRTLDGHFDYGRLLSVSDLYYALYLITSDGEYDGILVDSIDNILHVEVDGQYQRKMEKLCDYERLPIPTFDLNGDDLIVSILMAAISTKRIISLELNNSDHYDIVGFVISMEDGICRFKQVDAYGAEDGEAFARVADVTQVVYASEDENRIQRLWQAGVDS